MQNEIQAPRERDFQNPTLPHNTSTLTGINFGKLYKLIFKPKPTKKVTPVVTPSQSFPIAAREKLTDYFFIETLKIPVD